jgi:hypothetical protein
MSIGQKMSCPQDSMPVELRASLAERRLAEVIRFYQELRQLYLESTGIDYIPEGYAEKAKITPEDQAFLSDLGIAPIE